MENTPDRTDASRAYEMESAQITPEECEQNAAHSCPQWRPGWNLAAVTIRAFTERAEKAEQELVDERKGRRDDRLKWDVWLEEQRQELAALQDGSHPLQVQLREADCRAAKAEDAVEALRDEANARAEKAEADRDAYETIAVSEREARDDWRCRAEKAEQALAALRAETAGPCAICAVYRQQMQAAQAVLAGGDTAKERELRATVTRLMAETSDLREIERCKRSIEAAGHEWEHRSTNLSGALIYPMTLRWDGGNTARGYSPDNVETWQLMEAKAWSHAAAPYRERIEAAGYRLELRFGDPLYKPVRIVTPDLFSGEDFGEPGGSPTLALLEAVTAWAEAHPAKPEPEQAFTSVLVRRKDLGGDCYERTEWVASPDGTVLFDGDLYAQSDYELHVEAEQPRVKAEPDAAPEPERCDCGHEHQGCVGCARRNSAFPRGLCTDCSSIAISGQCYYMPAETRPYCGKQSHD